MAFLDTVPDNKAVILISGIPTEAGYQDFSAEIRRHRSRGLRFIGPNCMGVFLAPEIGRAGINTLFIGEERLSLRYGPYSNTALFTQSGAMGITSIERTQNLPIFKTIVSFGNKVDVDIPDLMGHFAEDPTVRLMAMYIEGMNAQEGRRMFDAACRIRKPIIVYKAGRTEAGAKAAASHTASMSGSYDVFSAACAQAGIILVEELTDFYNDMKVFAMQADFIPAGNRVGGVVNAGLDATMGADTLVFLQPGTLSSETRTRLTEINTHGLVDVGTSFLDVTPMTNDRMFADFLDAVLSDPGVDCAFVALVPHIENLKTTDDCCREPDAVATLLIEKVRRHGKPVVVSINSGNHYQEMVRYLEENGLPVYSDIRSAIKALDVFVSWHVSKTRCELQP
jgi:acyl-CoA synthetase (NDP forming)